MSSIWLLMDRIKVKFLSIYRRNVFLNKTSCRTKNVKILGKVYVNATNVKVGNNVTFYPGVYLWGDGEIVIGDNVDIGVGTVIFSKSKVFIGNNTSIAGQCYIIDSNHSVSRNSNINLQDLDFDEEGVFIGDDVWIAAGCKIIKGAKLILEQ